MLSSLWLKLVSHLLPSLSFKVGYFNIFFKILKHMPGQKFRFIHSIWNKPINQSRCIWKDLCTIKFRTRIVNFSEMFFFYLCRVRQISEETIFHPILLSFPNICSDELNLFAFWGIFSNNGDSLGVYNLATSYPL